MSTSSLPDDAELADLELLQADIDDESPEVVGAFLQTALDAGALDATASPLIMKKGRPGLRIEVLALPDGAEAMVALLLRETSTLGVRRLSVKRHGLARRMETVEVLGHCVRMKVALWNGRPIKSKAEFEDCRRVAAETGRPLRDIMALAAIEANRLTSL